MKLPKPKLTKLLKPKLTKPLKPKLFTLKSKLSKPLRPKLSKPKLNCKRRWPCTANNWLKRPRRTPATLRSSLNTLPPPL